MASHEPNLHYLRDAVGKTVLETRGTERFVVTVERYDPEKHGDGE